MINLTAKGNIRILIDRIIYDMINEMLMDRVIKFKISYDYKCYASHLLELHFDWIHKLS